MEVQTRNGMGEMLYFPTVRRAYSAWIKDNTIWKISWENYRFRPKTKNDVWSKPSEQKLYTLSLIYSNATENQLFWVNQSLIPHNIKDLYKRKEFLSEIEFDDLFLSECITEIISDEEFQKRYL
jgi:hypothetical protein